MPEQDEEAGFIAAHEIEETVCFIIDKTGLETMGGIPDLFSARSTPRRQEFTHMRRLTHEPSLISYASNLFLG
jgi:hypothetical protein